MTDTQVLFAQVLKDYNSAIENVKQLQQEKRSRVSCSVEIKRHSLAVRIRILRVRLYFIYLHYFPVE